MTAVELHPALLMVVIPVALVVFFLLTGQPVGLSLGVGVTAAVLVALGLLQPRDDR